MRPHPGYLGGAQRLKKRWELRPGRRVGRATVCGRRSCARTQSPRLRRFARTPVSVSERARRFVRSRSPMRRRRCAGARMMRGRRTRRRRVMRRRMMRWCSTVRPRVMRRRMMRWCSTVRPRVVRRRMMRWCSTVRPRVMRRRMRRRCSTVRSRVMRRCSTVRSRVMRRCSTVRSRVIRCVPRWCSVCIPGRHHPGWRPACKDGSEPQ